MSSLKSRFALPQGRRGRLLVAAVAVALVIAYPFIVQPYVFSSSLQATARVASSTSITTADLPQIAGLYLSGGRTYYLSIVRPLASNDSWAVVTPGSLPVGGLVYVASSVAQWTVQPYSMTIAGKAGFSTLIIGSSVSVVPQSTTNSENYYMSGGRSYLTASTIVALANPLYFLGIAWFLFRRIRLWMVVAVAWVYSAQFVASGVLGSAYGMSASFPLLAAAVVLLPGAYIANKLEVSIRERLARSP